MPAKRDLGKDTTSMFVTGKRFWFGQRKLVHWNIHVRWFRAHIALNQGSALVFTKNHRIEAYLWHRRWNGKAWVFDRLRPKVYVSRTAAEYGAIR